MRFRQEQYPVPHLIFDDFLPDFKSISSKAKELYYLSELGSHGVYEKNVLSRKEFYLYNYASNEDVRDFIETMRNAIWGEESVSYYRNAIYPYPMMRSTTFDGMLLGYYENGDYYNLHRDTTFLTCLLFLHEKKLFSGGDLVLTSRMSEDESFDQVTIESLPNRMVVFPSCCHHGVTPVNNVVDLHSMRISFQNFLSFANG